MLSVLELKEKQKYRSDLSDECIIQGYDRESILDECDFQTIKFLWYFREYVDFGSLEFSAINKQFLSKMAEKVNEKHGPFSTAQLDEIRKGFWTKKCINLKIYFNNKFTYHQMEQIRWGLDDGLEVKYYAKEEFSSFQMNEIRIGLMEGVDVSKYCDPKLTEHQMYLIKEKLVAEK